VTTTRHMTAACAMPAGRVSRCQRTCLSAPRAARVQRAAVSGRQRLVVRADAASSKPVLCIGEALWDGLPLGLFLGGAPVNVAQHMAQLGVPTACVSCVGDDTLGDEIRARLETRGVDTAFLQTDASLDTGFVKVTMGDGGIPSYDIVRPSAWDAIQTTEALLAAAEAAPAVIFGSLAQRDATSAATIQAVVAAAQKRVFDVNLREPFVDQEAILACMQDLYLLKINDEELERMAGWVGCSTDEKTAAAALAAKYNIQLVCVTRGGKGAALWISQGEEWLEHPGYGVTPIDTVGAGDSFLARLMQGLLAGEAPAAALSCANAMGAFVATQNGATPVHDNAAIAKLQAGGAAVGAATVGGDVGAYAGGGAADPIEAFCDEDPAADECRVYED